MFVNMRTEFRDIRLQALLNNERNGKKVFVFLLEGTKSPHVGQMSYVYVSACSQMSASTFP